METIAKKLITVEAVIDAPVEKVWTCWSEPKHITKWCQASDDWHAPHAENDLRTGGKFKTTMAAKDGSFSFDFEGVYNIVDMYKCIEYKIADGRNVKIVFEPVGSSTKIIEAFEAEDLHSIDMQRTGWQAILESFKRYTEVA